MFQNWSFSYLRLKNSGAKNICKMKWKNSNLRTEEPNLRNEGVWKTRRRSLWELLTDLKTKLRLQNIDKIDINAYPWKRCHFLRVALEAWGSQRHDPSQPTLPTTEQRHESFLKVIPRKLQTALLYPGWPYQLWYNSSAAAQWLIQLLCLTAGKPSTEQQ